MPVEHYEAVVIGGSAGSLPVLREIFVALPARHPLAFIVVLHQHKHGGSFLPGLLAQDSRLPVRPVHDKAEVTPGTIHVCPANYHTLVERTRTFALSTEPPEAFARPSIDVLFESASHVYRERLLGVVLSGGGTDGALGAATIPERGGTLLCQTPESATHPSMPRAAHARSARARLLTPEALAALLAEVTS